MVTALIVLALLLAVAEWGTRVTSTPWPYPCNRDRDREVADRRALG